MTRAAGASHVHLARGPGLHDTVADLCRHVPDGTGAVGDEDRLRLRAGRDVPQGLEVLCDEQQLGDLLRGELLARAVRDGVAEAVNDGAALPRNALALQLRGVRRRLGRLHDLDLLALRGHDGGVAEALLLVDLVHGLHDLRVRLQLCDKGLVDGKAIRGHLFGELLLDGIGDVILFLEGLVERHDGHLRPHHVGHVGVDLLVHVRQLVHGILHVLGLH
mmetsp:Transcript_57518/g.173921  ORF Transcript_57518/g.173921 Transcript_57518/m.173921 type:complete len:219 (+) Transcript_57518:346-1002(+)